MTKKSLIIGLFFISGALFSQDNKESGTSLSLKQAQEYALQHNYGVINAGRDVDAAQKKVWETTAIGLPQISADASFQNFIELPTSVIPANSFDPTAPADEFAELQFGTDYNTSATLSASQLIFDGTYIVGLQAAKTYKELSINNKIKSEAEMKDVVAQAYHTAVGAIKNHESLKVSHKSAVTILNETKAMLKEGLAEEQDVNQLDLNAKSLENAMNQAKRQVLLAHKMLKFQIGMDIEELITLSDTFESLVEMDTETSTLLSEELTVSNHFDYKLIQTNEKLMRLNYRKEKYAFAPSFSAFFSHSQQNFSNNFDVFSGGKWYPSTLWGLSVKLPLITSGMRLAKMGQAKIEYEKAMTNSKQVEQNLILQAQIAQSRYQMAYDTYETEKKNLVLAEGIHNSMIKKYGEGLVSSMEITQSQNQLLNVEALYKRAIYDLLNAKSTLKKALGNE